MEGEEFYGAAYKGSKQFTQQQVKTANATGFGAAADDYMERGIDLNEELIKNKPATYFFRMKGGGVFIVTITPIRFDCFSNIITVNDEIAIGIKINLDTYLDIIGAQREEEY